MEPNACKNITAAGFRTGCFGNGCCSRGMTRNLSCLRRGLRKHPLALEAAVVRPTGVQTGWNASSRTGVEPWLPSAQMEGQLLGSTRRKDQPLQNLICRLQTRRQQGERTSCIINVDPELSETHNSSSFTGVQKSLEEFHNRENFEKQVCLSGRAPLHDAISGSHIPVNHEQAMLPVGDTILPIEEAMSVLKAKASKLGKPLQVALPSDRGLMNEQKFELDGEHQYMNASLAVAMSHTWLQKVGLQLISAKSSNIHCLVSILPADILNLNVKKICALYELHHVPRRIVIFRTTMISGYTQTGVTNRALQLFEEMLQDWTEVTIVSVFPVCAHFAALDQEKWSLNYTRTLGFDLPPMALIARLVQTHHCFDCLSKKDKSMFLWNALIIASTSHGIGLEVISVFIDIVRNGVQANPISFSVLMHRCSHSGLVEDKRNKEIFEIPC